MQLLLVLVLFSIPACHAPAPEFLSAPLSARLSAPLSVGLSAQLSVPLSALLSAPSQSAPLCAKPAVSLLLGGARAVLAFWNLCVLAF